MRKARKTKSFWSLESMVATLKAVKDGIDLRDAAKTYNVPVETFSSLY